jgi:hypothetical protein
MTKNLSHECLSVDWTAVGAFRVLEACLVVQGRGIPFYILFGHLLCVHRDHRLLLFLKPFDLLVAAVKLGISITIIGPY